MRKIFLNSVIIIVVLFSSTLTYAQTTSFNEGWKFTSFEFVNQSKVDSFRRLGTNWSDQFMIEQINEKDHSDKEEHPSLLNEMKLLKYKKWQTVRLPHIAFPEPLIIIKPREGIAYYQKEFIIPAASKGKNISIEFEGAMQVSDVWVNGIYAGRHTGGYLPFEIEITNMVHYGSAKNSIVVKLQNKANPVVPPGKPVEKLDFIYYSGIYRDVWLHVQEPLHISNSISANKTAGGGVFVTYPYVTPQKAIVEVQTHVENFQNKTATFTIEQDLFDKKGKQVARFTGAVNKLKANQDSHYIQQLEVLNPQLWHPDHPHLYRLFTRIKSNQKIISEKITRIGIRTFQITSKDGLLINGEPFIITGTNRHQNYPYIGNAISNEASYRDAWLIKAAGMNAVRTGHYPPDPSFMDAADELGVLIINCIPGWQFFNKHPDFTEHVMNDIRQTIRRDRNHPCVLLWEMSLNETYPSAEFRCKQAEVAKSEWRGTGNFFTSGDSYYTKACWDVPYDDWNGDPGKRNNTTYPENPFLIREYGDYEFGGGNSSSRQTRAAGEKALLQQAWNLQWEHNKNRTNNPRAIGDLNWAFFDGLAGCTVGIEGWGVADLFRIPKYSYYFYKSQQPVKVNPQLPFASGPMVYIASNWNKQSDLSKLIVYSNCEEVALYMDGVLIGRQKPDSGPETDYGTDLEKGGKPFDGGNATRLTHPPFTFQLSVDKTGNLEAVGMVAGKPLATYKLSKPGTFSSIVIEPAINGLPWKAGGDMIFIYAKLVDEQHHLLTESSLPVTLHITGDAELLSPATVNAEAGIATFIIRSGKRKGDVLLKPVSGLKSGQSIYLKVNKR